MAIKTSTTSLILVALLQLLLRYSVADEWPIIQSTRFGDIQGKRKNVLNKEVDTFLGIPYAQPPVGELRYKPPKPWITRWDGPLDATEFGNNCWQPKLSLDHPGLMWQFATESLNEDCLFLNIWSPYPRRSDAAIMVWFHGGSFNWGSSGVKEYNGQVLAVTQNVIVITVNYRLGPLGFLSLGNSEVPGNVGLMDQAMALRWVKENIANFGGDPELVTIFGSSAGGASVGYHLFSPISRVLFRRAILESGTPNSPALRPIDDETNTVNTKKLIESLGCMYDERDLAHPDTIECLRNKPAEDVTSNVFAGKNHNIVIDGEFLDRDFDTMMAEHDFKSTEIMVGNCEREWMINLYLNNFYSLESQNPLTHALYRKYAHPCIKGANLSSAVTESVYFHYTDWTDPYNPIKLRDAVDAICGDYKLSCPSVQFVHTYAMAGNPAYYYSLHKRANASPWPEWMGAVHGQEITYVFGHPLDVTNEGFLKEDVYLSKQMMKHWANFAKYG
uniref:Carboxylic ester hydrolase n=1 Tax=Saccoglossus kowalevskii TaxID=10224 RepID=A0ABM0H0Z1_SACKO|nr:PREDICTED: cholinesterase-like [Saccoglossus kowalevskii]